MLRGTRVVAGREVDAEVDYLFFRIVLCSALPIDAALGADRPSK